MSSPLHKEPERDQFRSESPIRAFTEWQVQGLYALGKGFRPSLQHVVTYLHAMESKEGWRLVQILEVASQTPSFLFRQHQPPSDEELVLRLGDDGLRQQVLNLLGEQEEPYIRNREGFEEAGQKIEQAVKWSADLDNKPQADDPIHVPVDLHEEALRFIADKCGMDADRLVTDFMLYFKKRNQPNQVSHRTFYQQVQFLLSSANPRSLMQLIQEFLDSKQSADDPVNPKHYNGRACADLGERLSANGYQVLKYCWRLGKKDDPCQELGKAVWYGESELKLLVCMEGQGLTDRHMMPNLWGINHEGDNGRQFLEDRIGGCSDFTQNIARMLWAGYNHRKLQCIIETINEERFLRECGTGAA